MAQKILSFKRNRGFRSTVRCLSSLRADTGPIPRRSAASPSIVMISIGRSPPRLHYIRRCVRCESAESATLASRRNLCRRCAGRHTHCNLSQPHDALVTGVWPAKHGILGNVVFDPLGLNAQGWSWYAEDIRVPTLWDIAKDAGRTTATIQWPATVGARVTWNIPWVALSDIHEAGVRTP